MLSSGPSIDVDGSNGNVCSSSVDAEGISSIAEVTTLGAIRLVSISMDNAGEVDEACSSAEVTSSGVDTESSKLEDCESYAGMDEGNDEAPGIVAETRGDSDLLLTLDEVLLKTCAGAEYPEGEPAMVLLLLSDASEDELMSNELGIDRVTGRTVERSEVADGGGANVVAWSVDISGVEYMPGLDISLDVNSADGAAFRRVLDATNVLLPVSGDEPGVDRYSVE